TSMPHPAPKQHGPASTRIHPAFSDRSSERMMVPMTSPHATVSLPLASGRWAVDHNHSSIGFSIRHLGVSKVRGRFTRFDADVVIGETLATTSVPPTVDMASIDT